ncbi:DUF4190 domain-containing protein [Mycobacterium sp. NPDC051198]
MTSPFGGQPPDFGGGFGGYPPIVHGKQEPPPQKPHGAQSALAITSVVVGVGALLLAFVPYYIGLVAAAAGIAGLTVGIVALVRRGADGPTLAVVGSVTSALAVVMGVVMTVVYSSSNDSAQVPAAHTPAPSSDYSDTQKVLDDELELKIGDYVMPTAKYDETGDLSVSVTNRLPEARAFFVVIGAFDGNTQLASDSIAETLNAGQSKVATAFETGVGFEYTRLKNATFRVIEARSHAPK